MAEEKKKRKLSKKARRRRRRKKIILTIEILVILLLIPVIYVFYQMDRMQTTDIPDENIMVNDDFISENQDGYYNIALFGLDSREANLGKGTHSDVIMIASIHRKTKEVKLVSVYRDSYLQMPGGECKKATQAYFEGGPEKAINMLNTNLDLDIKDYIAVDFAAVANTINLLGGVEVDLTEDELYWINGYIDTTSSITGIDADALTTTGPQTLDGIQAVAYARIRYTEGDDYKRTERQRTVLSQALQKAQGASIPTLLSIVDERCV